MRRAWWICVGAAAAVTLIAGGVWWVHSTANPSTSSICPSTAAGRPTPPRGALVLSEQDGLYGSGRRTVQTHVGQRLIVLLDAGGAQGWTPLRLTGTAVDLISSSGGYRYPCPASPLTAQLVARRTGTSTLASTTDAGCFHAHPACAIPVRGWEVAVHVLVPSESRPGK